MTTWKKLELLGEGTYGRVFLAARIYKPSSFSTKTTSSSSPELVAVKSSAYEARNAVSSLMAEASFLEQLNGTPNVVQCFGEDSSVEEDPGGGGGGSLHDLIERTSGGMPETQVACYASMILRGLVRIHSRLIHCDLKPANLLVFPEPGGERGGGEIYRLKIADFGLARRADEEEVPAYHKKTKSFNRGTYLYSSPVSLNRGMHGTCTDIWSLGCIVVEMITSGERFQVSEYENLDDLCWEFLQKKQANN